jgi:N-acetylneuraminic acid mutarotase
MKMKTRIGTMVIACSLIIAGFFGINNIIVDNEVSAQEPDGGWTTKSLMPSARRNLAIGVVNNKIYAIGGNFGPPGCKQANEEYEPITDTWVTKAPMPTPRSSFAIGVVNNKIYAIGGSDDSNSLNVTEEYDPITDIWTTKAPMPTARKGLGIGVVNNKLYVIGGHPYGGSTTNVTEMYDPKTDTWTIKAPLSYGRRHLGIGVVNNKIYAIGGSDGSNSLKFNEEYNPDMDIWTTKAPMPTARWDFGIGVLINKIYAIGGTDSSHSLNVNEQYNPVNNAWVTKALMPTARRTSIGVVHNRIYAIGGTTGSGGLNLNEEYNLYPLGLPIPPTPDSDSDGMSDGWEVTYYLDPLNATDADQDIDNPFNDGLSNLQEYLNDTDPHNPDTDGDQLGDGFELTFSKTDPTLWDSNNNSIGDGIEFSQRHGYIGSMNTLPTDWIRMTIIWEDYTIYIQTNSSVLEGEFDMDKKKLTVKVSGPKDTSGAVNITIPKDLCNISDINVLLDGSPLYFTLTQDYTYYIIYATYTHSAREITTIFETTTPYKEKSIFQEPWFLALIAMILGILLLTVLLAIRKRKETIEKPKEEEEKEGIEGQSSSLEDEESEETTAHDIRKSR